MKLTDISICICTRNRQEGLKSLLKSLDEMQIPSGANIRIIVVENNSENFSEHIVKEFSEKSTIGISYFLETSQGLAFARNRSVKEAGNCDFCCFVDDDQIVKSDWLSELVKCQTEFNADGVSGQNPPIFSNKVLVSVEKFHMPVVYQYGTIVKSAYTNCLLLRKKYLDQIEGPFDLKLNFTGGEDSYLTGLITNNGGVIRYNPNAIAYEIIPKDRTTIKFVLKRTYRISNEGLFVMTLRDSKFSKWNALPRLIMRFSLGVLIVVPYFLFGNVNKLKGLIKISDAMGGFSFILGSKNKYYK